MKLGELEQHCGNCKIIECCGEPWSDIMLCANLKFKDIEESDYMEFYKNNFDKYCVAENIESTNIAIERAAEKYFDFIGEKEE